MTIGHVVNGRIGFLEMDELTIREIDKQLLYKSEAVPLDGPDGPGEPFVAFVRKGGFRARSTVWEFNVMVPRLWWREPDLSLSGPVLVAAYREDGSLRGLTPTEQKQLQIWRGGPGYRYPLLMVADPE